MLAQRSLPFLRAVSSRRLTIMGARASSQSSEQPKKIVVVGGVAGGASCAARLRRLSETAEITIFEKGPYVSFANCGLPYAVGDIIQVSHISVCAV